MKILRCMFWFTLGFILPQTSFTSSLWVSEQPYSEKKRTNWILFPHPFSFLSLIVCCKWYAPSHCHGSNNNNCTSGGCCFKKYAKRVMRCITILNLYIGTRWVFSTDHCGSNKVPYDTHSVCMHAYEIMILPTSLDSCNGSGFRNSM